LGEVPTIAAGLFLRTGGFKAKTYRHWIKEATDRLDDVQQQAWLKQGLDKDGNPRKVAIE
jgi:hypothetical protein